MQAVILAAGRGKRLQPLTTYRTKAMAPIAGKPMVERVIETLLPNGIDDFTLIISPDDPLIEPHFRRTRPDLPMRFLVQHERLGMAHALRLAAPFLQGDFVMSACDNLTPATHIADLITTHHARSASATLSLMEIDIAHSASTGIVEWAQPVTQSWIRRIVEKPKPADAPSNISSLPLYVFSQQLLEYLPRVQLSTRGEYELQDAIQLLIEATGRVTGVLTPSREQITNIADLLALNRHFLVADPTAAQVLTTQIGTGTQIINPVRIEADATIGANCVIGPNVLIEAGAHVTADTHLRDTIILGNGQPLTAPASSN